MRYLISFCVLAFLGALAFVISIHAVRYLKKEESKEEKWSKKPPSALDQ